MLPKPQTGVRMQMGRRLLRPQLLKGRAPRLRRILQFSSDHRFPECPAPHRYGLSIKEVLDERSSLCRALALIKNSRCSGTNRKHGVHHGALIALPAIEEHLDVGPCSLLITNRNGILRIRSNRLTAVLRRKMIISDHRAELSEYRVCLVKLSAPHRQPGLEQSQVGMMLRRRIQFERPLDHGRCPAPLTEGK